MKTITQSECRVVIINDLDTTLRRFVLPSTVEEAEKNCIPLRRAISFARELEFAAELPPGCPLCEPESDLAVTVRKTAGSITIRWWACGDEEAALEKFREITEGDGRAFA